MEHDKNIYSDTKGMRIMKSIRNGWQKSNLMLRVFIGIVVGSVLALLVPGVSVISLLGDLFVGALKAMAPVLVAMLVVSSVATARAGLGRRFRTVVTLYMLTTLMAAVVAVLASSIFPINIALANVQGVSASAPGALGDVFRNIVGNVMSNPITAIANANYLSILFWAIVIGLALKMVASEQTITKLKQVITRVLVETEYLDSNRSERINPVYLHPILENAIRSNNDDIILPAFNHFT